MATDAVGTPLHRIPGETGVWVFILGDMVVFAALFVSYVWNLRQDPVGFSAAQQTLSIGHAVASTVLLLVSSLFVVYGMRALVAREGARARMWLVGALACALAFIGIKVLDWSALSSAFSTTTNDFYMYYFIMTGLHLFHLVIGTGVLVFLIATTRLKRLTASRLSVAEAGACFWHMVDLLWVAVFPLLYLVHLREV